MDGDLDICMAFREMSTTGRKGRARVVGRVPEVGTAGGRWSGGYTCMGRAWPCHIARRVRWEMCIMRENTHCVVCRTAKFASGEAIEAEEIGAVDKWYRN